jgi:hypothetical protein
VADARAAFAYGEWVAVHGSRDKFLAAMAQVPDAEPEPRDRK